jgi:5-methyltetrahydrofolate--homocysteine methyltransferase
MPDLKEILKKTGTLVADGATGTMLQNSGLPHGAAPERWNLENPSAVRALYRAYVDAGADIILTNTFGGSRTRLEREDLGEKTSEINRAAARLAREVAGDKVIVFGDIGPTGKLLTPLGPLVPADAVDAFAEQAAALAEGDTDAILIETMSDLAEAQLAIEGVRKVVGLPILVTFSFDTRGHTMMGLKPALAAREIWAMGVAAVGANCGRTLSETLSAIQSMRQAVPEAVLMAKPNAGLPHADGGDLVYDVTPEIMADYALKFAAEGVKIFGGCCGSTPDHIRAVAKALRQINS